MTRCARGLIVAVLGTALGGSAHAAAQRPPAPPISVPSVVAPPTWWRTISMADGRKFVTDGGISIDAAIVKPDRLPEALPPASAAAIARQLQTATDAETSLGELRPGSRSNTFVTPGGVIINGNYVTALRATEAAPQIRLRTKGRTDPVVIAIGGLPVGVMMPVQPPKE